MHIQIDMGKALKRFLKCGRPDSIVKLPKKGDLGDFHNWIGVTLLPITSKVFIKIIHTRRAEALDE